MKATNEDCAGAVAIGDAVIVSTAVTEVSRERNNGGKAALRSQNLLLALLPVPIDIISPARQVINLPQRVAGIGH
jgi:hypothetical protein